MKGEHKVSMERLGGNRERYSVLRSRPTLGHSFEVICHCNNEHDANQIRALLDLGSDELPHDIEQMKLVKK